MLMNSNLNFVASLLSVTTVAYITIIMYWKRLAHFLHQKMNNIVFIEELHKKVALILIIKAKVIRLNAEIRFPVYRLQYSTIF